MADSPTYLPVHSLSTDMSPSRNDYIVVQQETTAVQNGDVVLVSIDDFIGSFFQETIDGAQISQEVIDLYESMGWTNSDS